MPTSFSTLVRRAVVDTADADATLQALCGRDYSLLVPWRTIKTVPRPVGAYLMTSNTRVSGDGDMRSVQILMAGLAEGDSALDTAEAMIQRLRELITPQMFLTKGVEAWVDPEFVTDRDSEPEDAETTPTNRARADLDLLIRGKAPQS